MQKEETPLFTYILIEVERLETERVASIKELERANAWMHSRCPGGYSVKVKQTANADSYTKTSTRVRQDLVDLTRSSPIFKWEPVHLTAAPTEARSERKRFATHEQAKNLLWFPRRSMPHIERSWCLKKFLLSVLWMSNLSTYRLLSGRSLPLISWNQDSQ